MSLLVLAVLAGLAAGLIRARSTHSTYDIKDLNYAWLVPIAYLPQLVAFQLPATRSKLAAEHAAAALVGSQLILLGFAWSNRKQPGFGLLGLGLVLNLAVILLNGGLMPISPETAARLIPEVPPETWKPGNRLGTGKDILMATKDTRLWWLADQFLLPVWIPYRAAYSIGDILMAAGVFWLLWSSGRQKNRAGFIRRGI